jgi:MarR family transcriptional regulator, transcriptional regulator for hemolysin
VEADEESLTLTVARAARTLARAFDDALAAAGGSRPTWLALRALTTEPRTQAELAAAVGVRQPTMSHHLDGLERAGLVARERRAGDRRVQRVTLTAAGERLLVRLRRAAAAFDGRLGAGLTAAEQAELRRLLAAVEENAGPD